MQTKRSNRVRWAIISLIVGALCIVAAAVVYADPWEDNASEENIQWGLTLVGVDQQQMVLSYDDIKSMPSYEGRGGFFTSVGVINGPFYVKGIPMTDMCALVGGITPSDIVFVSAQDGYSAVFSYDRITGDLDTYDPETMRVTPHDELKLILAYELDGKPLSYEDGRPLRLAAVGDDELLTEGYYWVKWVVKIEVVRQNTD